MKNKDYERDLKLLAKDLGIGIIEIKNPDDEGLCKVNGKIYILLDKDAVSDHKSIQIAKALNEFGVEDLYIKPYLRDYINSSAADQLYSSIL